MAAHAPYIKVLDIEQTLADLQETVDRLQQERSDLEIALTTAIEHGDAIEMQLELANRQLRSEVNERLVVEKQLRDLVSTITQKSRDLEMVLQTITEHSDQIDLQWLGRYIESENEARRDSVTGLPNRRMLDECIAREWARARRNREPLAMLMCDVDYFKSYNDFYGHNAGDECLRQIATLLQDTLRRESDLAARYGGEEFVLLLPDTDADGALKLAQTLQDAIATAAIAHQAAPLGRLTVSIGLAAAVPDNEDSSAMLAEADRLLYLAKQRGRNLIVMQ